MTGNKKKASWKAMQKKKSHPSKLAQAAMAIALGGMIAGASPDRAWAQTNGGTGRETYPEDSAREDAQLVGKFIRAFSAQNPQGLAELLKGAQTVSVFEGSQTDQTRNRFLELWGEHKHRITGMETQREGDTLTVTLTENGDVYKLTHVVTIDKAEKRVKAIVMETPRDRRRPKIEEEQSWRSGSLGEAEAQLLAAMSETTPTCKSGKTMFEEGPELESTTFGIQQAHEVTVGVALIVRNKKTGVTAANSTVKKSSEEAVEGEEFRRLKTIVAEKMASDPIFQGVWKE